MSNCFPLSEAKTLGIPNLHTMYFQTKLLCPLSGTSAIAPQWGIAPWCLIPTEQTTMGLSLGSILRTTVWWYCWTFDTCHRLWHKSGHPSAWWPSNILSALSTPNGFRKSFRVPLSWRSLLLQDPSTLSIGERSLSCTRRPLLRRIVLLVPLASLWPPFCLVRRHSLSMKLTVWFSCFQDLSLTLRSNLLVEKAEQKRVHYQE